MLDFDKKIESKHFTLRALQNNDFEALKAITKDKQMWYYFTSDLSSESELKQWVKEAVQDHKNKKSLPFVIIENKSGQIVGSTRIANISVKDSRIEIGWTWIAKNHQSIGVNKHVTQMLFDYLFTETSTLRIEFKTDVLNIPARKALQKLGLIEEGILRSHTLMTNNRRRDTIFYSILKEEWLKKKQQDTAMHISNSDLNNKTQV